MFATRNLHRQCLKAVSSLLQFNPSKNVLFLRDVSPKLLSSNVVQPCKPSEDCFFSLSTSFNPFVGWSRSMSTSRGRSSMRSKVTSGGGSSMRSKVAKRMQKESGKTQREVRRANKIKKKLMTENERLIYNLKRAKRKVALLLQKLKKYELPDLPPPRHDPELLTLEQLQAFKKIGFRNKNYVPVGVRGVFGGVVQNMHLHWKFHETVQVCCDNFPREKIKEMANMLARLSGGIVINIHNVKTIIMFRGRNYRQPKNLIPFNTLTKRKALFKARFEQALESQKLNIKKIEQQLRRSGVNPEDPVAMASIQRVASSFFNAIDQKEGSPYVFHGDKLAVTEPDNKLKHSEPPDEKEQEELDKFIAEIEDAAEREWAAEEAAEKEEFTRLRYWNREEFGGRYRRTEALENDDSDDEIPRARGWRDTRGEQRPNDTDYRRSEALEIDDSDDEIPRARGWRDTRGEQRPNDTDYRRSEALAIDDSDDEIPRARGWRDTRGEQRPNDTDYRRSEALEIDDSDDEIPRARGWRDTRGEQRPNDTDYRRSEALAIDDSDDEIPRARGWRDTRGKQRPRPNDSDCEDDDEEWDSNNVVDAIVVDSDADESDGMPEKFKVPSTRDGGKQDKIGRSKNDDRFKTNARVNNRKIIADEGTESENMLSDLETAMWQSDAEEEHDSTASRAVNYDYRSSSDDEDDLNYMKGEKLEVSRVAKGKEHNSEYFKGNADFKVTRKLVEEDFESDDNFSDLGDVMFPEDSRASTEGRFSYKSSEEEDYQVRREEKKGNGIKRTRTAKELDENWDSD